VKRGGGETGSTERGLATACADSAAEILALGANARAESGSTNATAVTSGFSEFSQQAIEQFIMSLMPCSHSISVCCAGAF
jgi:hypothetical protein